MTWPMVKLSDVCQVNPRLPKTYDENQEVSFLAMASVSEDGKLLTQETRTLGETKKGFTYFERGDVIVAKITPCFENGKAVYLEELNTQIGFGSTEFHVLRPNTERLNGKYLFYLIWNSKFRSIAERSMSGSAGQKRVPADFFKNFEIPLPPLVEQKRIAAILDKADAIRQKRQQAIALADQFLRSVFLDMFGDPVTNPKGWPLTKCQNIFERITVGIVVKPSSYYVEAGVPALRSQNIKEYGIEKNNLVYISKFDNENTLSKSRIFEGDVVIVRTGQPGKTAVVTNEFDGVNAIDILIATPKSTHLNADYFSFFMNSAGGINLVSAEKRGQVQQHFNVSSLNHASLPLPPLELQVQFIKVLRQIKKKYFSERTHDYDELFNSLSQKAFSGQL